MDFDNKFDDRGQKLSARIQYEESLEDELGDIESTTKLPGLLPSLFEKVSTLENQKRFLKEKCTFRDGWPAIWKESPPLSGLPKFLK